MKGRSCNTTKAFIKFAKMYLFFSFNFWQIPKASVNVFMCMTNCKNPLLKNFSHGQHLGKNANKCKFLLSFTQLSIWNNNFFGKSLGRIICFGILNSHMQHKLPYIKHVNNAFYKGAQTRYAVQKLEFFPKFEITTTRI